MGSTFIARYQRESENSSIVSPPGRPTRKRKNKCMLTEPTTIPRIKTPNAIAVRGPEI